MKKRLISFIMMLVMLVSLFSVFATTASADAQVTTVTVAKGDTVLSICQAKGIDFYTYKNLIMKLNGFTSESAFSKIAVGTQISLPVSNAAAAALANGTTAATTTGTTVAGSTTSSSLTTGTVSSLPSGDRVAYYLATYTVSSGETISGIYGGWGLSYKTYENQIVKLNNLRSVSSIQAGKTLILPTTNPGLAGSTYTTVMAHTMRSGESAYNVICSDYGLNYSSAQAMLQSLNNRTDLGVFRVGETLYIPVSGVVTASTTTNTTTGTTTTNGTVNTSGYYNLVSETATNGSFDLQVSGKSVKTASAGQVVTVVSVPNTGYAVDTIKVSKVGDTATTTTVSNNSFVMPAYSAIVSVTFKQAKQSEITIDASNNGGIVTMVDNTPVSKAYAGTQVTVKTTPATGFKLDNIRVTYNEYRDTVAVENGKFTMPNVPVTVTVTFKVDPDYNPTKGYRIFTDVTNATVTAKLGSTATEYAKAGDRVTLEVTPNSNYVLESIKVYYDDFKKTATLDKMSFDMPDGPVTVVAVVKPTSDAKFAINVAENPDGNVKITVDGKEVTSASPGQTVKIESSSSKAYYYALSTVTKVGDSSTVINLGEGNTFTMPDYAVNVNVKFYVYHRVVLDSSNGTLGSFNVTANGGTVITSCGAGVKLYVNTWGVKNGYAAGTITLHYADGSSYTLVNTNEFIMPDCDVRVRVDFKPSVKLVAHPAFDNNTETTNCPSWGNSYTVLGRTLADKSGTAGQTVELWAAGGNTIVVKPSANIGYELAEIYYIVDYNEKTKYPAYKNAQTGNWQFEMPSNVNERVDLYVRFKEIASYTITSDPLDKDNTWGSVEYMTSLGYTDKVAEKSKVWIRPNVKSEYTLDWNKVEILDAAGVPITTKCSYDPIDHSFVMPEQDVIVDFTSAITNQMHKISYQRIASDGTTAKGVIKCTIDNITYTDFTGSDGKGELLNADKSTLYVKAGTGIIVTHESLPGYYLDSIKVTTDSGEAVKVTQLSETTCSFVMPLENVTITPVYKDDFFVIDAKTSANGTYSIPANASLGSGAEITDIKPAAGYKIDHVYMSYTDINGQVFDKKEVAKSDDGKYIVKPTTLPNGAVTVEVEFAPVSQDLTIVYEFGSDEGSISTSNTYKVDVLVDGVKQEINRNTSTVKDKEFKEDTVPNGVATGKTVVISENTNGKDERFEITNIWVLYNGDSDAAQKYTNGDYYFTMPNVEIGSCEVHVRYALKDSNKYDFVADVTGGTITEINGRTLAENTSSATTAIAVGSNITVKVKKNTEYDVTNKIAYISYTDFDGVKHDNEATAEASYDQANTFTFTIPITGKPQSDVKFKFVLDKSKVSVKAATNAEAIKVDNKNPCIGDTVTVTPAKENTLITAVKLYSWNDGTKEATDITETCKPTISADGTKVTLTAPDTDVYVDLTLEAMPVTANVTLKTEGNGGGTVTMKAGTTDITSGGSAGESEIITITAPVAEDSYDIGSSLKVVIDNKELALSNIFLYKNGSKIEGKTYDGTYVEQDEYHFRVPSDAKNIAVTVTFAQNKHTIEVKRTAENATTKVTVNVNDKDVFTDISGNNAGSIKAGDKVKVTVDASDQNYTIGSMTVSYTSTNTSDTTKNISDVTVNSDGSATFTMPALQDIKADSKVTLTIGLAAKSTTT